MKIDERSQVSTWKTPKRENVENEGSKKLSGSSKRIILTSPDINHDFEKHVLASGLVKNSSQGGTRARAVNLFKGGLKESVAKKVGELKEGSLGGAMRVLREPIVAPAINDSIHRPTIKALRVPSLSSTIAEISLKPSPTLIPEISNIPSQCVEVVDKKPATKRKIVVAEFTKPKKSENLPDLVTLYSRAKSSDWQTRCKSFESLMTLINSKDFKPSPKLTEMVLLGLDDNHFRVVNSVYDVISSILERNHQIEPFFVKTVSAIYNAYSSKSRQSSFEHSEELLRRMVVSLNESAIPIILNMVSDPGLMRKPKAKNGLLSMLCSIRLDFLSSFISKASSMFSSFAKFRF